MANGNSLVLTRVLPASREKVSAAWTEAAMIKQWFCPSEGMTVPVAVHKNISAYWERLKERASVQKTHTDAKPIVEEFRSKNAA